VNERLPIVFAASVSIVKIRYIGDSGIISLMTARTSGAIRSVRGVFMT
jgi:hypothetical protein